MLSVCVCRLILLRVLVKIVLLCIVCSVSVICSCLSIGFVLILRVKSC